MKIKTSIIIGLLLACGCASSAGAATLFFPLDPPPGVTDPPYDRKLFNINYPAGSASFGSAIVIGFEFDGSLPNSLPYPFARPYTTTVNLLTNGRFNAYTSVFSESTLNVNGGFAIAGVSVYDKSKVNLITGGIQSLSAQSKSEVTISGGLVSISAVAFEGSKITLSGGEIIGTLGASDDGGVVMSGGQVGRVSLAGDATAAIAGGNVRGDVLISGNVGLLWNSTSVGGPFAAGQDARGSVNGASIAKGVSSSDRSALTLNGSNVGEDVTASGQSSISVVGGSIAGSVFANERSTITLQDTTVKGSSLISVSAAGGSVFISNATLTGRLVVQSGAGPGFASFTSGSIGTEVGSKGESSFIMTGGTVGGHVIADEYSTMTISGGTLAKNLESYGEAEVYLSGGSVGGDVKAVGGLVQVTGGTIAGSLIAEAGDIDFAGGQVAGSALASGDLYGILIRGGTIENFVASTDTAEVTVAGGVVKGAAQVLKNSSLTILGGTVGGVQAKEDSRTTLSAGVVKGTLVASERAVVNIMGGTITEQAVAIGTAEINWHGGDILGGLIVTPGVSPLLALPLATAPASLPFLIAYDDAVINIFGADLVATLVDGAAEGGLFSRFAITGIRADGTRIEGGFIHVENGAGAAFHLVPAPVPEPSSLAVLGVGFLWVARRRRRSD